MKPGKLIINFLLSAILVLIIVSFNWITFTNPPVFTGSEFVNNLLVAGIIGTLMFIIGVIFDFIYKIMKFATLGIAKIFFPIYFIAVGYLKLFIPTLFLNDWYEYSTSIFAVIIISILVGLFRLPPEKD